MCYYLYPETQPGSEFWLFSRLAACLVRECDPPGVAPRGIARVAADGLRAFQRQSSSVTRISHNYHNLGGLLQFVAKSQGQPPHKSNEHLTSDFRTSL